MEVRREAFGSPSTLPKVNHPVHLDYLEFLLCWMGSLQNGTLTAASVLGVWGSSGGWTEAGRIADEKALLDLGPHLWKISDWEVDTLAWWDVCSWITVHERELGDELKALSLLSVLKNVTGPISWGSVKKSALKVTKWPTQWANIKLTAFYV